MLVVAATTFDLLKYTVNGSPLKDAHSGRRLINLAAGLSKSWKGPQVPRVHAVFDDGFGVYLSHPLLNSFSELLP